MINKREFTPELDEIANALKLQQNTKDCREQNLSIGDKIAIETALGNVVMADVIGIYKNHILVEYATKKGYIKQSINYGTLVAKGVL